MVSKLEILWWLKKIGAIHRATSNGQKVGGTKKEVMRSTKLYQEIGAVHRATSNGRSYPYPNKV